MKGSLPFRVWEKTEVFSVERQQVKNVQFLSDAFTIQNEVALETMSSHDDR